MKAETIDAIIGIAITVIAWVHIIGYIRRSYKRPCKWHIKYWR